MSVGVHRTHCCYKHGCKYGAMTKDVCPVVTGEVKQAYRCEYCDEAWRDLGSPQCAASGCANPGYWLWSGGKVANVAMVVVKVTFYLCDGHDEWHRSPEWSIQAKPMEKRVL